MNARLNNKHKL